MYEILFLDLDDTILDFHKAERVAISKTIRDFGVEPTEEILARYHIINKRHWDQLELGTMTRVQVLENRFAVLFSELGVTADKTACARVYERNLSIGHYFLPGAEEAVASLSKKYRLFLASNGTTSVQMDRIASANLERFFEKIFISQQMGHNKPSKAYFDACFAQISNFDRSKTLIVGDSLTSDIRGGNNAGIATCWVNSQGLTCREDVQVDYEIPALSQLEAMLERV